MNNKRVRNWTITANRGAGCYTEVEAVLQSISEKCHYALVRHKPNTEEEHKHIVIEFKCGHTFSSVQKMFTGADLEETISRAGAVQYLTHKNNPEKEQYEIGCVHTNDNEWLTSRYTWDLTARKAVSDLSNEILLDLLRLAKANATELTPPHINSTYFFVKYGNKAKPYLAMIKEVSKNLIDNYNDTIEYLEELENQILPF